MTNESFFKPQTEAEAKAQADRIIAKFERTWGRAFRTSNLRSVAEEAAKIFPARRPA